MKAKTASRCLMVILITFLLLFQVGCDDDRESEIIEALGHYIRLHTLLSGTHVEYCERLGESLYLGVFFYSVFTNTTAGEIDELLWQLWPARPGATTRESPTPISLTTWMHTPHWEAWQQQPPGQRPRWSDAYAQWIDMRGARVEVEPLTADNSADSNDLASIRLAGEWEGTMTFFEHRLSVPSIGDQASFEEIIAQAITEYFVMLFDEMMGVPLKLVLSFAEPDGGEPGTYRAATKIVIPDKVNDEINRKWIEKEGGPADPFQPPMTNTQATVVGDQVFFSTLFFEDESGTTFDSQPKLYFTGTGDFTRFDKLLSGTFILQADGGEVGRGVWECRRKD